jgi:8-oxo-dGTP diphosphatase
MRESAVLVVAAALYDAAGRVLIAQRPAGKALAGRWEFPGGKVADGESERAALARELREELGIEVAAARPLMRLHHDYDDRSVELSLWTIEHYSGTPQCLDGQRLKWVLPAHLAEEDILEADQPFVTLLGGARPAR